MINKPYKVVKDEPDVEATKTICWKFCREIFKLHDKILPEFPHRGIKRICEGGIVIPCIVLFVCGDSWHSGIVWPDGLHFIHVKYEEPLQNEENKKPCFMVRQERLTRWPWVNILEGFYINAS